MYKKNNESNTKAVQRFGLRKLTVGLAGVALGTTLALANPTTQTVKADTVPDDPDQVNTQPSGEQAAKQELQATKQVTTPAKAAANQASAKLAAKTTPAKPVAAKTENTQTQQPTGTTNNQTSQHVNVNNSQPVHNNVQNSNSAKQVEQNTNSTQVSQANNANQVTPKPSVTNKKKKVNKVKAAQKAAPKLAKSALTSIGAQDEAPASDAAHNKYVNRNINWYTVDDQGNKRFLTTINQQVRFGQIWNDYGNGKEYTPWEQDTRRVSFSPYTNDDLLKDYQSQIGENGFTQDDYNTIVNLFKTAQSITDDSGQATTGAPQLGNIGPLSSDANYNIYIKTKTKVSAYDVTIIYRDLDDPNKKILSTKTYHSAPGNTIDATTDYQSTITDLTGKGYTHSVDDDTLPNKGLIAIPAESDLDGKTSAVYEVGLHHKIIEYGPGENNPFTNKNDDSNLVKNVTQTIKYTGTNTTIPDNTQTIKFSRHGVTDMVTGQTTYKDWDKTSDKYQDVTSPTVDGYVPDQTVINGTTVTPTSNDTTKTVTYAPADQMRDAIVHYRYDSWNSNKEVFPDKNRKIAAKDGSDGQLVFNKDDFNQDIIQKDGYTASVMHTNVQGGVIHAWIVYVKNPENDFVVHFIDQDNNNQPIKDVSDVTANNVIGSPVQKPAGVDDILDKLDKLGYEVVSDPFKNPPTAINGKQEVNYVLKHKKVAVNPITNRKETVHFVNEQGESIAPDSVQTGEFTHSGTTDLVTGETTWTGWSANKTTNAVNVPVVNGYIATQKQVPSQTLTPDQDIDITVKYTKIGKLIPVDDNGKTIPGATQPNYVNDPTDPTKVKPDQPVPDVPGYTPDVSKVTPTDPTKDTPVKYHQNATPTPPTENTSLGVIVHDDDTGQDLNDYQWSSGTVTPGGKVSYDWAKEKQRLIDHGYVVVQEPLIPDYYSKTAQVITIHVKHGIVHVNPQNPKTPGDKINQGDAKWPETSLYQHDRKYTVHFVDSKGRKLAPDQVQTMHFGRDLQIDAVTGKILNPDAKWTPQYDQYAGIQAAKINGYRFNSKSLAGVSLVKDVLPGPNAVDSDISDSIVYTADDQVPNDPGNGGIDSGKGNNQLGKPDKTPEATPAKPATTPKTTPQAVQKAINHAQVQKASALPQTGGDTKQSLALALLGLVALTLSTGAGLDKMRKH